MVDIVITRGSVPLSVEIQIDMGKYCQACRDLRESERREVAVTASVKMVSSQDSVQDELSKDGSLRSIDSGVDLIEMVAALEQKLPDFKANFAKEREQFLIKLTGLSGALIWKDIKIALSEQCDTDDAFQKSIAESLVSRVTIAPAALQSLNDSFIELVKNSLDALLRQYLEANAENTVLKMSVALEITPPNIQVIITDNAGGFSQAYLDGFVQFIQSGEYKKIKETDKTKKVEEAELDVESKDSQYYFGGASLGMPMLCTMLLDGERLENQTLLLAGKVAQHKTSSKQYIVPADNSASIAITNNASVGGAEIVLTSALTPYAAVREPAKDAFFKPQREGMAFSSSKLAKRRAEKPQEQTEDASKEGGDLSRELGVKRKNEDEGDFDSKRSILSPQ